MRHAAHAPTAVSCLWQHESRFGVFVSTAGPDGASRSRSEAHAAIRSCPQLPARRDRRARSLARAPHAASGSEDRARTSGAPQRATALASSRAYPSASAASRRQLSGGLFLDTQTSVSLSRSRKPRPETLSASVTLPSTMSQLRSSTVPRVRMRTMVTACPAILVPRSLACST